MPSERRERMEEFLRASGWGGARIAPLPGDASTRRYLRLERGGRKALLMDQPQGAETPPAPATATQAARALLGYNAVARLAGADCTRFVAVANFLRARGLSAPEVLAADPVSGFVLLEDLGDTLYTDALAAGADEATLYAAAAEVLAKLHAETAPAEVAAGTALHAYDETALVAETDLLPEWFLPLALGRKADEAEILEHRALWKAALGPLLAAPPVFVHRDYHAQNLFWLPQRKGLARVGLIDFQDAVAGPPAYDLVSLIEDARREVPAGRARQTATHYMSAMRDAGLTLDAETFAAGMAVTAAQRNAKIAGIFARLHSRDGKPRYLSYLPLVWTYLARDLENPALAPLQAWYDRTIPHEKRVIAAEAAS